jgi:hypothetical protein
MRTACFVGPTFSRPAYHRRTHHGQEEEKEERKEVIDPMGRSRCDRGAGLRWRIAISKAEKGPMLASALFCYGRLILVVTAFGARIHVSP